MTNELKHKKTSHPNNKSSSSFKSLCSTSQWSNDNIDAWITIVEAQFITSQIVKPIKCLIKEVQSHAEIWNINPYYCPSYCKRNRGQIWIECLGFLETYGHPSNVLKKLKNYEIILNNN
ncbi:hypothetical protein BLOT_007382 [Blomia tropicalis]|nr:hypothetical protein BLOT_007382 [Blomia tropicalis]